MHGCWLVLMLLACSCQAFNYTGTAFTYHPLKESNATTVVRYKLAFQECGNVTVVDCPLDDCTVNVVSVKRVDENSGVWCQDEVTVHVDISDNFTLNLDGLKWINVTNNVTDVLAITHADVRIRSDTGRPNMSPRTTIIPLYRVPSNCYFQSRMPIFDSDGDEVECFPLNPDNNPDILKIVDGCFLNFLPIFNNSSVEGTYAVQVVMADIARHDLTLTDAAGNEKFIHKYGAISEVPIQFVLKVDPPLKSCYEGEYLPLFLHPTPNDGDHLSAFVNQTLEIKIYAKAKKSMITQVLFSGPAGVTKTSLGGGDFVLAWTPTPDDAGLRQAICFVVEATRDDTILQSEMRCVIVAVDHSGERPGQFRHGNAESRLRLSNDNKNNNSVEGAYAVQVVMADIARHDLTLTDAAGNEKFIYKYGAISEVPIQFVLKVDPPVESCSEGEYLPLFLHPTPNDGDHLYAFVNQTLEIKIYAKAEKSMITQLLFSGPAGVTKTSLGDGDFVLAWTPTPDDAGRRQAICFVVEASLNNTILQSEMRCVIVAVDHLLMALDAKFLSRSFSTLFDIEHIALPRLKKELVDRGLPPDITLRVVDYSEKKDFEVDD